MSDEELRLQEDTKLRVRASNHNDRQESFNYFVDRIMFVKEMDLKSVLDLAIVKECQDFLKVERYTGEAQL